MSEESKFTGEIGIHYPLHVLNRHSLPELIDLAETAQGVMGRFGPPALGVPMGTKYSVSYRIVGQRIVSDFARMELTLLPLVLVEDENERFYA